jgi:periplasmic divalent cation tolerance protein
MSKAGAALAWCPFPDEASAAMVAEVLLDEGLVACANLLPAVRSLYRWRGERGESGEAGALFKTTAALLDRTVARIAELHPYETPAVVGWRCETAAPATVAWLGELGGGTG